MRISFVIAAEPTQAYANMVRLCAWSIRRRAGSLSDSEISVVFNDCEHAEAARDLREWGVSVETRDRLSSAMKCMNKYNALFTRAAVDSDWVVLLDCDTAVVDSLDPLREWMETSGDEYGGVPVDVARVWGLDRLAAEYADFTVEEINKHRIDATNVLPYFNGGVVAIRGSRLPEFRSLVIDFSYRLYEQMRAGGGHGLHWARVQWNRFASKRAQTEQFIVKPFFHKGYADQVALALAMMKLRLRYRVLPHAYNWRLARFAAPDEAGSRILHYLSAYYPIDRENLFNGSWIGEYETSEEPGRRALARLVRDYAQATSAGERQGMPRELVPAPGEPR